MPARVNGRGVMPRLSARLLGYTATALLMASGAASAGQYVDWNADGTMDLIVGAEDGHIYCYHRAALDEPGKLDAVKE